MTFFRDFEISSELTYLNQLHCSCCLSRMRLAQCYLQYLPYFHLAVFCHLVRPLPNRRMAVQCLWVLLTRQGTGLNIFRFFQKKAITSIILKILTEHIDSICSSESELFFVSVCSIVILTTLEVIFKNVQPYTQAGTSSTPTNEEILQAEITAPFNTMMQFNSLRRRYDELHRDLNRPFHRRNYDESGRGPSHPRRSLNQITQQYYLQRLNSRRTVSAIFEKILLQKFSKISWVLRIKHVLSKV